MSVSARLALLPCALVLGLAAAAPSARAAESYDNCTGFIEALPATISTQGVWCLKANLSTALSSGAAITIAANNVTIDCNDFKVGGLQAGSSTLAHGVFSENRLNATVRNCGIRGFYRGIWLYGSGGGHLVERNRLDQNYNAGIMINLSSDNRVIDNRVFDTGGQPDGAVAWGIFVEGDAVDNTVSTVFGVNANLIANGIVAQGVGSEVRGNRVRNLLATGTGVARGISAMSHNMTVSGNRVSNAVVAPNASNGVYVSGNDVFCLTNTVAGYPAAYAGCDHSVGNLPVSP